PRAPALYEPAPRLFGLVSDRSAGAAMAVGRAGGFPWFAVPASQPERAARSLARRLAVRGRIAGVLALDAVGRRLALAVAFDGTPALCIDLDHPLPESIASLGRIKGNAGDGALAYAAKVAEALSTENAGKRFFRQFKSALERMTSVLPGNIRGEDRQA